jgi:predicted site-specific integrase-resolvase
MPHYLTVTQAADWYDVHPNTIWRWVAAGILPDTRGPSGRLMFTLDDLQRAMLEKP